MANGIIDFYNGRMNGGKTTSMFMAAHAIEQSGNAKALIVVPEFLVTDGEHSPRNKMFRRDVDILLREDEYISERVYEIADSLGKVCLKGVFVDEAQFLTNNQVYDLAHFANENKKIDVRAYGIRADFKGVPFEATATLFGVSNPISIEAACHLCGSHQSFLNVRLINGVYNFDPNADQTAVNNQGGVTYETNCLDCISTIVRDAHNNGEVIAESVLRLVGIKN